MRILHLADLHLGKLLFDVHMTDDQRHVLEQASVIAAEKAVDVVAISGDVYDRAIPPVEAVNLLDDFLADLSDAGKTVLLIPGNHDGAERLAFGRRLFRGRGVHIAPPVNAVVPVVLSDAHGPVTFYPVPFLTPFDLRQTVERADLQSFTDVFRTLFDALPEPPRGRTVCIAHCYAAGGFRNDESEERPLLIGGSEVTDPSVFRPFSLTLLGHLHRPQRIGESAWYAGAPLHYAFSEDGSPKRFHIFDLDATGAVTLETVPVSPLRRLRSLSGKLEALVEAGISDPARDDYLSVTLTDRGALFDAARKIREAYPNLLHVLRLPEGNDDVGEIPGGEAARGRADREVVSDFYAYVGDGLQAEEQSVIDEILDGMLAAERSG
jgi:exonuclease SbcD